MGNGVEHSATPLLVGLEDHEHIGERWVGHRPGGAQCIGAMNEQITQAQFRRQARNADASVSGAAETFNQFGYWSASSPLGHSVNGPIWLHRVMDDLPEHGQPPTLRHRHEVAQYVSDTPAGTP